MLARLRLLPLPPVVLWLGLRESVDGDSDDVGSASRDEGLLRDLLRELVELAR